MSLCNHDSWMNLCVASVYAPPGQSINLSNFIFCRYIIIPPIDAHEIFSQYHMYFLNGSHFAQNLKMALLSLSLNLETQYHTQSWTQSGATYSQGIIDMVYVQKSINVFKNFTLWGVCGVCVCSSWPEYE